MIALSVGPFRLTRPADSGEVSDLPAVAALPAASRAPILTSMKIATAATLTSSNRCGWSAWGTDLERVLSLRATVRMLPSSDGPRPTHAARGWR